MVLADSECGSPMPPTVAPSPKKYHGREKDVYTRGAQGIKEGKKRLKLEKEKFLKELAKNKKGKKIQGKKGKIKQLKLTKKQKEKLTKS